MYFCPWYLYWLMLVEMYHDRAWWHSNYSLYLEHPRHCFQPVIWWSIVYWEGLPLVELQLHYSIWCSISFRCNKQCSVWNIQPFSDVFQHICNASMWDQSVQVYKWEGNEQKILKPREDPNNPGNPRHTSWKFNSLPLNIYRAPIGSRRTSSSPIMAFRGPNSLAPENGWLEDDRFLLG